jgi:putative transposase
MDAIREAHRASYGTYGHRRVHAELVLGQQQKVSRGQVERLMRATGLQGVHRRRLRGCTRRDQAATPSDDLVERQFRPEAPDRLYVADITQHRTDQGRYYLAVVLDCFSRRVVGWAMADHIRSELVVDALQMAIWNRRPQPGAIHHSDHGLTYISWAFGQRLREAGLLGSMGSIGDCFDNSVAESLFATLPEPPDPWGRGPAWSRGEASASSRSWPCRPLVRRTPSCVMLGSVTPATCRNLVYMLHKPACASLSTQRSAPVTASATTWHRP